jgi:hypothetical protein
MTGAQFTRDGLAGSRANGGAAWSSGSGRMSTITSGGAVLRCDESRAKGSAALAIYGSFRRDRRQFDNVAVKFDVGDANWLRAKLESRCYQLHSTSDNGTRNMRIWTLEKTIEAHFERASDGVRFRIEVYRDDDDPRAYRIRLMRYEGFRLTPSFGAYPEGGADHEVLVSDPFFDDQEIIADSLDAAVHVVLRKLRDQGFS